MDLLSIMCPRLMLKAIIWLNNWHLILNNVQPAGVFSFLPIRADQVKRKHSVSVIELDGCAGIQPGFTQKSMRLAGV